MKRQTCCFTGHRKIPLNQLEQLTQRLKDAVTACIQEGYLYFGAGGALGFDTLAAKTILELKAKYPEIKLGQYRTEKVPNTAECDIIKPWINK